MVTAEEAIENVVDEVIFPLLDEYDISVWEDIDYIPLADEFQSLVKKYEGDDDAIKKDLVAWILEGKYYE